MKKIHSMMAMAAIATAPAFAQYTLPTENAALQDKDGYNMMLSKSYDFATPAIDGVAFDGSTIAWGTANSSVGAFKYLGNTQKSGQCTAEGLENFLYQIEAPTWKSGTGLQCSSKGIRGFAINGLKANQIVVIQGSNGANSAGTDATYNGFCIPNCVEIEKGTWALIYADPVQVEDISAEVNAINGTNYLYLLVKQDGVINLPTEKNAIISGVQVWDEYTDEESVSAPTLKIASVDGTNRTWSWNPGTSSQGNDVTTYYSFGTADPATAGVALAAGDVISSTSAAAEDIVDDQLTVNIVSVSANGTASDVTSSTFDLSAITLNAPSVSLVGIDGVKRSYKISWTANTLCNEASSIVYSTPTTSGAVENGGIVEVTDAPLTATVSVTGYTDGVATLESLAAEGINLSVKKSWDFENLTDEQYAAITGDEAGWTYTEGKGRSFLNLDADDATAYVADQTGIFDGLTVYAKPGNYSTLGFYVTGDDNYRGIWSMVNGTITVQDVEVGDYIVYTITGETSVLEVAEGETTATISVTKSTYVNNIKVYSASEESGEEEVPVGIESVTSANNAPLSIFTADGKKISSVRKGLNIVNGKKIMVK